VDLLGVLAGGFGQADDGVLIDAHHAGRLADATAFLEVTEDSIGFSLGESGIEQGSAFAFGEALLTGAAGKDPPLVGTIPETHAQIVESALAVVGADRILAAEDREIIHEVNIHEKTGMLWTPWWRYPTTVDGRWQY
jgi:hypothetical protein